MTEALQKAEQENERLRDVVCDMASALVEISDAFAEDWESDEAMDAMEHPLPYYVAKDMVSYIDTKYGLHVLCRLRGPESPLVRSASLS